ncbi:MAG: hypothetical protein Q9190_007353 [Brigantiaea leucoxantha]
MGQKLFQESSTSHQTDTLPPSRQIASNMLQDTTDTYDVAKARYWDAFHTESLYNALSSAPVDDHDGHPSDQEDNGEGPSQGFTRGQNEFPSSSSDGLSFTQVDGPEDPGVYNALSAAPVDDHDYVGTPFHPILSQADGYPVSSLFNIPGTYIGYARGDNGQWFCGHPGCDHSGTINHDQIT